MYFHVVTEFFVTHFVFVSLPDLLMLPFTAFCYEWSPVISRLAFACPVIIFQTIYKFQTVDSKLYNVL